LSKRGPGENHRSNAHHPSNELVTVYLPRALMDEWRAFRKKYALQLTNLVRYAIEEQLYGGRHFQRRHKAAKK
jgi:hypothetical protein